MRERSSRVGRCEEKRADDDRRNCGEVLATRGERETRAGDADVTSRRWFVDIRK